MAVALSEALARARGEVAIVRRICVVVTARPSWAKLEPVCRALKARPEVELQIVACASALLERYGRTDAIIEAQGYQITERVWSTYEGANLLTSAKESGALAGELASVVSRLHPDVGVVCADRHEVLAAAQAFAYSHVTLAHLQGGEKSGSIDDKVRDSITMLADVHFPATQRAAFRVYSLTGSDRVYHVGCPSVDVAKQAQTEPLVSVEELGGGGMDITDEDGNDLYPGVIVLQHPVTQEAADAYEQMRLTLHTVATRRHLRGPAIAFWPGEDAGADGASKALREYQSNFHTVRNLPPNRFLRLLTQGDCVLVGNSSCGIREASYLGVRVVNIGSRQNNRERGPNVIDVPHDAEQIAAAIQRQIAHGRYPSSDKYGQGNAGEQIAEVLTDERVSHRAGPLRVARLSR